HTSRSRRASTPRRSSSRWTPRPSRRRRTSAGTAGSPSIWRASTPTSCRASSARHGGGRRRRSSRRRSRREGEVTAPLGPEHDLEFPLVHGNAEHVPYPEASFDLAISEYGASIWADPDAWIPEAARLLRPGGRLVFLINATLLILCMPDEERSATNELLRPLRGLGR